MTLPAREAWMTAELEAELKEIAANGTISCSQVQQFAAEHTLEITKMKPFVDIIGLKVSGCQKVCT
ncbi:MAG: hypothetical protein GY850_11815 [bacterium]|nr:hypothetical protein [bacterium]